MQCQNSGVGKLFLQRTVSPFTAVKEAVVFGLSALITMKEILKFIHERHVE